MFSIMSKVSSFYQGYNIDVLFDGGNRIETCVVRTRKEALVITRNAELRGCDYWRILYKK